MSPLNVFKAKGDKENAEALRNFITANKVDIDPLKNIAAKERKILNENEIVNTVKVFNAETEEFKKETNDFEKEYLEFDKEFERIKSFGSDEINANPTLKQQYLNLLDKQKEYVSRYKNLEEKQQYFKTLGYKLDRIAGEYYEKSSKQGEFGAAIYNKFIAGGTSNYGKTALRAVFGVAADVATTDEMEADQIRVYAEKNNIEIPEGLDDQGVIKFIQDYDTVIKYAPNPTLLKTTSKSFPTYEKIIAAPKDEFVKEMLYKGDIYRNPYSRIAASTDTEMGMADAIDVGVRKLLMTGNTTQQYEELKQEGFWGGAILGLAESLPAMMGAGSAGWAQRTAQMYSLTTEHVYDEMEKDPAFDNITEREKFYVTAPIGIAVGVLESIGFRNIVSQKGLLNGIVARAIGASTEKTTAKTFGEFIKNDVKNMMSRGVLTITGAGLAEFETGFAQEIAEVGIKDIYNMSKGKDMFQTPDTFTEYFTQALRAGAQEMVGGFIMGTIPAAASMAKKGKLNELSDEQWGIFSKIIKDPNYKNIYKAELQRKIAAGEITSEQAQESMSQLDLLVSVSEEVGSDLNEKSQKEVIQLLIEKKRLTEEKRDKDESLVKGKQNRIDEINSRIEKIVEENAVQEQETRVVPDAEQAQDVQEMEDAPVGNRTDFKVGDQFFWGFVGEVVTVTEVDNDSVTFTDPRNGRTRKAGKVGVLNTINNPLDTTYSELNQQNTEQTAVEEEVNLPDSVTQEDAADIQDLFSEQAPTQPTEETATEEAVIEEAVAEEQAPIQTTEQVEEQASTTDKLTTDELFDLDTDGVTAVGLDAKSAMNTRLNQRGGISEKARGFSIKAAAKAAKAVSKILPKLRIVLHGNNEEYIKYVGREGRGEFIPSENVIHINMSEATKTTVAHEIFHAVFLNKLKTDARAAKAAEKMMMSVRKTLANDSDLAKRIDEFASNYDENIQNEERLAELIGILASEFRTLKRSAKQRVVDFLKGIARSFGIQLESDFGKDDKDVIDLLNTIARKTAKGELITEEDVSILEQEQGTGGQVGTFSFPRQSKLGVDTKSAKQDSRDFVRNIVEDIDLREFEGQKFITNMYDHTSAGKIDLGNGHVINLYGGRNFVPYIMDVEGKQIGDVSSLASFNSQANVDSFIRNVKESGARLFAPHAGTPQQSWQFQQHIFSELTNMAINDGILTQDEIIDMFNKNLNSVKGKKAFDIFAKKYSITEQVEEQAPETVDSNKLITNLDEFRGRVTDLVSLLDINMNLSPDLRKVLNNSYSTNKKIQAALGIKNSEQFYRLIQDELNEGVDGGEIMTVIKFDPSTFEVVKTEPNQDIHHPSFGYTLRAKIEGVYQPTKFFKSYDLTDSYTKHNKDGGVVVSKKSDPKFAQSNVTSSAGAIPKVAELSVPDRQQKLDEGKAEADAMKSGKKKLSNPMKIFKGLGGKVDLKGARITAHKGVKGVFAANDLELANQYAGDVGVSEAIIPEGAVIEVVEVTPGKITVGKFRSQEVEAINNSDADIVKLITLDGRMRAGEKRQVQYVVKNTDIITDITETPQPRQQLIVEEEIELGKLMNPTRISIAGIDISDIIFATGYGSSRVIENKAKSIQSTIDYAKSMSKPFKDKGATEVKYLRDALLRDIDTQISVLNELIDSQKNKITSKDGSLKQRVADRIGKNQVRIDLLNEVKTTVSENLLLPSDLEISDTPQPRQQKTMNEIIQEARDNNFSDNTIRDYLVRTLKMKAKIVDKALEIPATLFSMLPKSFKDMKGGANVGMDLYQKIADYRKKLETRNSRSTWKTDSEIKAMVVDFRKKLRSTYDTNAQIDEKVEKFEEKVKRENKKRRFKLSSTEVSKKVSDYRKKITEERNAKREKVDGEVQRFEANEIRKNNRRVKPLSEQEIMTKMIEFMQEQDEFIQEGDTYTEKGETKFRQGLSTQQARMISELQKSVGIRPTQDMSAKIRKARVAVRERMKGKRDLQSIKKAMRNFIRQSLPSFVYSKSDVINMIRKITDANENNIQNLMAEVEEFVVSKNVQFLSKKINDLLNGKYTDTINGKKKGVKIDILTKENIEKIKSYIVNAKSTAEEIILANGVLQAKWNELNKKPNVTFEEQMEMVNLQVAIEMNNSMLMENNDSNKVDALDIVYTTLSEMIDFGQTTLQNQLAEEKAEYDRQFEVAYEEITGSKVDMGDPNSDLQLEQEKNEMTNEDSKKSVSNRIKSVALSFIRGVDAYFTASEALDGLMDKISSSIGEMFGGKLQDEITAKVDEASRKFKERRMFVEYQVKNKLEELYGKNWQKEARNNRKKTVEIYLDKKLIDQAQEEYNKNPTQENKDALDKALKQSRMYSQNQLYYLYNQFKDPANMGAFINMFASGISDNELAKEKVRDIMSQIEDKLDDRVKAFADWQVDEFFPSLYDHYNDTYKKIYRTNMPWNVHYAGRIFRDGVTPEPLDLLSDTSQFTNTVNGSSTKARTNNNLKIKEMDGTDALMTYLNDMEYFAAYAPTVRDINKVFTNEYIKNAITSIHGAKTMALIENMIQKIANKGTRTEQMASFVNAMNTVFILARLALSPVIAIKQLISTFTFADNIGVRNWIKYSAKSIPELKSVWAEIRNNSVYMQDRKYDSIMKALESYSDTAMQEFVPSPTKDFIINVMMYLVKFGDRSAIYLGGTPNYMYYKDQALKSGKSEQEAIDIAVRKFEKDTKRTQQSSDLQDKDVFQTSNPVVRALNMFLSTPKQYFRKEIQAVRSLNRKLLAWDKNAGKGSIKQNVRTLLMYHVFMPVLFQYVSAGLPGLLRGWRDDDDDDLIRAGVIGNLNSLFIMGEVISALGDYFTDKPWAGESSKTVGIISEASMIIKKFKKADNVKDAEKKAKYTKDAVLELVSLTGIPAPTISKMVDNYSKVLDSDDFGEAILRLLNFSEYQISGSKKSEEKYKTIDEINKEYDSELNREAKEKKTNERRLERSINRDRSRGRGTERRTRRR